MMRPATFGLLISSLAPILIAFADQIPYLREPTFISRIRQDMPSGWHCTLIRQYGEKGHPHGLKRPVFRADFAAPQQFFTDGKRRVSPLIQLYLYDIAEKAYVLAVIAREQFYSWNIPIYFGETENYIVVTSPSYVNHGIFTEEAKKAIQPMWNVLRRHIPNREFDSTDELAQPDAMP